MKFVFAMYVCLTSFLSQAQSGGSRLDSVNKLKSIIQAKHILAPKGVGYASAPSRYWYSFAFVLAISTKEEILMMTHDASPAIRAYAYIGLIHFNYEKLGVVKRRLLEDSALMPAITGCSVEEITVAQAVNSIRNWYKEKSLSSCLKAIQTDGRYRSQLYEELLNNGRITPCASN